MNGSYIDVIEGPSCIWSVPQLVSQLVVLDPFYHLRRQDLSALCLILRRAQSTERSVRDDEATHLNLCLI